MLLVIFGAGASFDSAPTYPPLNPPHKDGLFDRPPLANQLFDNRDRFATALQRFSECQPLIPRLRGLEEGVTIEELLEEYQSQAADYPKRHTQLAAIRYYLHFVLWELQRHWENTHRGVTNYKTLLDDLERWRSKSKQPICLVTFNYDTMLESALPVLDLNIRNLADYVSDKNYKVIKVHGSVNWAHEVVDPFIECLESGNADLIAHELIAKATELKLSDQFRVVDVYPIGIGPRGGGRVALFPALALPVRSKASFECPDYHLKSLRDFLPEVTEILSIGWAAAEEHFLTLLRADLKHVPRLMIIGANKDDAFLTARSLMASGIGRDPYCGEGGFTDSIKSREIDAFLWSNS